MRRAVSARHTTELEALLVDDRFDGDVYPAEPMARHTMYRIEQAATGGSLNDTIAGKAPGNMTNF